MPAPPPHPGAGPPRRHRRHPPHHGPCPAHGGDSGTAWAAREGGPFHTGVSLEHGALSCDSCHDAERTGLKLADGKKREFADAMDLCAQCHGDKADAYARAPGVLITRYTPERGQRDVPSPYRDLYPFGWIDVTFHPNGRTATLLTRCQLGDPDGRPCPGHEDDDQTWPLNAYQWTIGSLRARLQALDLPPGAVVDPTGTRYAWTDGDQLGVRGLDGEGLRFVPVPAAP